VLATRLAEKMDIPQVIIDGRRVTDEATLNIAVMVYAGLVNKSIVAKLQSHGVNAIGLSGADGDVVRAKKRPSHPVDYGLVGDVVNVNTTTLSLLLNNNIHPVIAPITHDAQGVLLNTNADTMASAVAVSLASVYRVELIYCFEKNGVLLDVLNPRSVISAIDRETFNRLTDDGVISAGMKPKLSNALNAVEAGVSRVLIAHASRLAEIFSGSPAGTSIVQSVAEVQ
jgi:acetylglutamate kinase